LDRRKVVEFRTDSEKEIEITKKLVEQLKQRLGLKITIVVREE